MNIIDKIFNFWRWHPEVALRYWPVARQIKKLKRNNRNLSILEVGSGWLGIAPYLGLPVVGLDKDFGEKKFHLLRQVKGDLLNLPFIKDSFDVLINVDVLEHLPSYLRIKVLEEILRVAKKGIFLAAPCGKKSLAQDKQLDKEYSKVFAKPFPYLMQHLKYGLPEEKKLSQLIFLAAKKQNKKIQIQVKGNENLFLRQFLMKGWITKNFFIDIFFRKILLFFIPFFAFWDKPPYYRQTFFVTIKT